MPKTQQYSGITQNGIITDFIEEYEAAMESGWEGDVSNYFMSDQESETYKWLGASPGLREWVGGRQPKGLRENGMTIENKLWEATLVFSVEDIRREKGRQIRTRIAEVAEQAGEHFQELLSNFIAYGDGDTYGVCYDGQYFFDTDHSEGKSGTHKNSLSASDYTPLNIGTADKPTADEASKALYAVASHFYTFLNDQGRPMNGRARRFQLHCPINLMGAFDQALTEQRLDTGSGTRDNVALNRRFRIELVPNPWLTLAGWTTKWALLRADGATKPLIRQEEYPVVPKLKGAGSEYEFDNNAWSFGVDASHNVGYGLWQHAILATFS